MAIGDILFGLMGQQNPQQQLTRALGQGPSNSPMGQAIASGSNAAPPPTSGAAPSGVPQPQQQPQPQAYQTPPDLGTMYLNLMQRQQANQQINTGLGLLTGAFSHNQADRENMINAMSGLNQNMPNAGAQVSELAQLQQTMWQRQALMQQYAMAPTYAKQLGVPVEQVTASIMAGKLPDLIDAANRQRMLQASPLYGAQVGQAQAETGKTVAETGAIPATVAKTQAETGLATAQAGAVPATTAKTVAETGLTTAQTGAVAPTIAKTQAETAGTQATTAKTQQDVIARQKLMANIPTIARATGLDPDLLSSLPPEQVATIAAGQSEPTPDMKNYSYAMKQLPPNTPKPSFNDWTVQQAGAKEAATQSNLLQTQQRMSAQAALPDATAKIREQLQLADSVLNDPNFNNLTGIGGTSIGKLFTAFPGTSGQALQAKIDQLKGATAVSAVDSLRGVGRILGTEFAAGTDAQSRLHDQSMPAKDYIEAVKDYKNKLRTQLAIVTQKAGMPIPADLADALPGAGQKKNPMWNPKTGTFE